MNKLQLLTRINNGCTSAVYFLKKNGSPTNTSGPVELHDRRLIQTVIRISAVELTHACWITTLAENVAFSSQSSFTHFGSFASILSASVPTAHPLSGQITKEIQTPKLCSLCSGHVEEWIQLSAEYNLKRLLCNCTIKNWCPTFPGATHGS